MTKLNTLGFLNSDDSLHFDGLDLLDSPGGGEGPEPGLGAHTEPSGFAPIHTLDLGGSTGGLSALSAGSGLADLAHAASDGGALIRMSGVATIDGSFAAKGGGGGGGKPGGGGSGGGGTGGDPSVLTEYISHGADNNAALDFNVDVVFKGSNWTQQLQQAFINAADYISTIITDDIADVLFRGKLIDDIRIDAELVTIDGTGGVLGQAGPTSYRTANYLPATATMQFDVADASYYDDSTHFSDGTGRFDDIVLHEMLHSIGFGTMWSYMGLTSGSIAGGDLKFMGQNAMDAYYSEFGGTGGVPVETDGGSGTAGGHWDDATFKNELMTGYIGSPGNGGDPNYVSHMTVAALEDMGYATIWGDPGVTWPDDPIRWA
jgi:hypothetical protein